MIGTVQVLERNLGGSRTAQHCTVKVNGQECGQNTREGKPWCSDHVVDHSPYVQDLIQRIEGAVGAA